MKSISAQHKTNRKKGKHTASNRVENRGLTDRSGSKRNSERHEKGAVNTKAGESESTGRRERPGRQRISASHPRSTKSKMGVCLGFGKAREGIEAKGKNDERRNHPSIWEA